MNLMNRMYPYHKLSGQIVEKYTLTGVQCALLQKNVKMTKITKNAYNKSQ
jgi:hypothetical protein